MQSTNHARACLPEAPTDDYKCWVCGKLLLDPKDCKECEESFCSQCISVEDNCPCCKKNNSFKNVHKRLRDRLENLDL